MLVSATILGIAVAVLFSFGPGEPADANVIDAVSFRSKTGAKLKFAGSNRKPATFRRLT